MTELRFDPNSTLRWRDETDLLRQYALYAVQMDSWQPGWHLLDVTPLAGLLRQQALMRRAAKTRHTIAPMPMGCRWCGVGGREHGQRSAPGHPDHLWKQPTREQADARLRVKLANDRKARAARTKELTGA